MAGGAVELTWCSLQVSALETIVNKGGRVVEADIVVLTEALMNELIKLDADGDVKAQRRIQEKRMQKHVRGPRTVARPPPGRPRVCVVDDQQWNHLGSCQGRPSGGEVSGVHRGLRYQVCWQGSQKHNDRCDFHKSRSNARAFD
jgi:hypothetical protein